MNKRGDIASIIYIVIFLAVVGIIILFLVDLNIKLFTEIEGALNGTSEYNNTEAHKQATEFKETNTSRIWDYAFLGIFLGSLFAIGLSAYAVRISPIFYWVYGVMSLMVLTLGTILSNLWQGIAADSSFETTITYFPITNSLLGSYYPMIVTAVIVLAMVVLFGKPARGEEGFI